MNCEKMILYITHLKDILQNNYLGIKIPVTMIQSYLNELKDILGEDDYVKFTENQIKRDGGHYHITVINVADYNRLCKSMGMDKFINSLDPIFKYPIDDLRMLGVGRAQKNENTAFYVVCESDKLDAVRGRFELGEQDFHITLGFNFKDVFGVRKNEIFKKEGKFLQLLRSEFYKNGNWNFIKKIKNFDLDPKSEIIPVKLTDSTMKFKCDGYYLDIGYGEEGEELRIYTKYTIGEELPRMPEAEIARIINKK
jgi:hypothetical protein